MHFLSMLPTDGTVLDIGANLGFLSAHIARHLTNGNVIAFEPMPDNLNALNYVVKKFDLKNVLFFCPLQTLLVKCKIGKT